MSVTSVKMTNSSGRVRGSHVYMLLCQEGASGPIYIKVGLTDHPTDRLMALRNGCPVPPKVFASVEVPGRSIAKVVEAGLHKAFRKWRTEQGEWFKLTQEEKAEFNQSWQPVLQKHSKPSWPLVWSKLSVPEYVKYTKQRTGLWKYRWKRNGEAYRDFVRNGGNRA